MSDFTEVDRESIQRKAAAMGKTNTLHLLLSLRHGSNDTAPEWHSVGVETYAREKMGNVDDHSACQTFARWVAGTGTEKGQETEVQVRGFHFVASTFELQDGQLTKRARIFTTIRKGQMLAFAFSANSPEVLDKIADSINTIDSVRRK